MNKENSMIENEMSTEIGDTMKSYSSKYRKLKELRNPSKISFRGILPVKLERAAVTIQRFWRHRMILRRKLYSQLESELDNQIALLSFENDSLRKIIDVYDKDCQALATAKAKKAERQINVNKNECNMVIKELVGLTLHMSRQQVP